MRLQLWKAGLPLAAVFVLTGCMDDNYDLNDIDTTTSVPINDVTIPVNLQEIMIEDVLDLTDNENIVEATDANGKRIYAISKTGDLSSDDIVIDPIDVKAEDVNSSAVTISSVSATLPDVGAMDVVYEVEDMESDFSYKASNIDDAVVSIEAIETAGLASYDITLSVPSSINVQNMTLHNVKIQFPKGVYMSDGKPAKASIGTYDPASGIVTIEKHTTDGGNLVVSLTGDRFDLTANNVTIDNDRNFNYKGVLGVLKEGYVVLTPGSQASLPSSISFTADYQMSHFYVKNFDGEIDYSVEGIDIEPISFDDLPDFLKSSDTQIFLNNPQIYLSAKNSTANYNTEASAKIRLISEFNDGSVNVAESETFVLSDKYGADTDANIVLSPNGTETDALPAYSNNLSKYVFNGLGNILASNNNPDGLPARIKVELEQPRFFGNAKKFPVKVPGANKDEYTIAGLNGSYEMFAPLAFDPNSRVVYNKIDDGWQTEDLDALEITRFVLTAHAETTIGLEVQLTLYPLGPGNVKLGRSYPVVLPAMANEDIELVVESTPDSPIRNLDGVEYHAVVCDNGKEPSEPLGPTETINLTQIKVKVSGSYTKEF